MTPFSFTITFIVVFLNIFAASMIKDANGIKKMWLKILLLIPPFGIIYAIFLIVSNFVDCYFFDKKDDEEETFREL
jgi:apolipoprotein N-acyltransferase